jgi:CDP-paratose 2-epimerase
MSTNKVYGDNPNKLPLLEKKTRWELKKSHKYQNGIDETMSIDNCTHSFFGASKSYADLVVQEYGKNIGLKTACFRAGCITGPNHSGAKLHGFLSYLVKSSLQNKKYSLIGYKGKQVRDNIHSQDLVSCFWEFYKKPGIGEVYNIGGGRYSNCSIIEALNTIEKISKVKIKRKILTQNRIGDHIWYISDMKKFKKRYPKWKKKYSTLKIIKELINEFS